jgi:superfamily II DNA/RNA helicase
MTPFTSLGLDAKLLKAIADSGFTTPTPVQEQAIPPVLQGRDVMACAQTGTGKTAAFVLPALHRLMQTEPQGYGKGPRVLVLTPTRELAAQIHENIQTFSKYTPVSSTMIIGGVAYAAQIQALKKRQDIVIATPGRLIDHMEAERIDFSRVEMVVLDEADRMLDMGFLKPIESIFAAVSNPVQTLLFSATFDAGIEKIAAKKLKNPARVQLAVANQNHDQITQTFYKANDTAHKQNMLRQILKDADVWQAIVFIATKHGADRLAKTISKMGHKTAALHGDMRQNARKKVISQMHNGSVRVLVATDVAARGLDVTDLSHVINYDLPMVAEDYTHRIGRTGRASKTGIALSFVNGKDMGALKGIERMLGKRVDMQFMKGADPSAEEKSGTLEVVIEEQPRFERPFNKGRSDSFGHKNRTGKPSFGQRRDDTPRKEWTPRPDRAARTDDRPASPYKGKASPDDLQKATLTTRKPKWDNTRADKPRTDRPWGDKPRTDKPRTDKPTWGKPATAAAGGSKKPFGKPRFAAEGIAKPAAKPFAGKGKPFGAKGKPTGAKPAGFGGFKARPKQGAPKQRPQRHSASA